MKKDKDIIFISNEQGAASLDILRTEFPDRFINAGISEQNIITMSAGIASLGKKVFVYSIASFITLRCFEQIKIDLCVMKLPVTIVGVGASYSYSKDGPTHHATEDISIIRTLSNIEIFSPSDSFQAKLIVSKCLNSKKPTYVRLDRQVFPPLIKKKINLNIGFNIFYNSKKYCIVSTGCMVHKALKLSYELKKHKIEIMVIDLYKIKPITIKFKNLIKKFKKIISIEENILSGGIGSIISEIITDGNSNSRLLRFGLNEKYLYNYGDRDYLHKKHKLELNQLKNSSLKFLNDKS